MTVSTNFWACKKLNENQLRALLMTNASAIALGHETLKLECRVRLQGTPGPNSVAESMAPLNLSWAFAAEGRLAEIENHPQNAVKCYLDMVRLGYQSSRGGLIVDGLKGIVIESRGVDNLKTISGSLDAKSCAEIAKTLESLDSQRPSMSTYVQQERIWERQNFPGLKNTIVVYLMHLPFTYAAEVQGKATQTYAKQVSGIRHEMVEIAAQAYSLDKGTHPKDVADLVPNYLKAVPKDPATGANITLSP